MAHAAVGLLDSISEFCRRAGMAEFDLRPTGRQRWEIRFASEGWRPHHA